MLHAYHGLKAVQGTTSYIVNRVCWSVASWELPRAAHVGHEGVAHTSRICFPNEPHFLVRWRAASKPQYTNFLGLNTSHWCFVKNHPADETRGGTELSASANQRSPSYQLSRNFGRVYRFRGTELKPLRNLATGELRWVHTTQAHSKTIQAVHTGLCGFATKRNLLAVTRHAEPTNQDLSSGEE